MTGHYGGRRGGTLQSGGADAALRGMQDNDAGVEGREKDGRERKGRGGIQCGSKRIYTLPSIG